MMGTGVYLTTNIQTAAQYGSVLPIGMIPVFGCDVDTSDAICSGDELVVDCSRVTIRYIALVSLGGDKIVIWAIKPILSLVEDDIKVDQSLEKVDHSLEKVDQSLKDVIEMLL